MIDIILLGTGSPMVDPNRAGPSTLVSVHFVVESLLPVSTARISS